MTRQTTHLILNAHYHTNSQIVAYLTPVQEVPEALSDPVMTDLFDTFNKQISERSPSVNRTDGKGGPGND